MWILWLAIIIFLAVIELATINLVTVWFIASALISLVLSLFDISFAIQFAVFVIVGAILLVLTRKPLQNMINKNKVKTNVDRIIGMNGVVTKEITPTKAGEVKVDGKYWRAISDANIKKDSTVVVLKIEGVKIIVKEVI